MKIVGCDLSGFDKSLSVYDIIDVARSTGTEFLLPLFIEVGVLAHRRLGNLTGWFLYRQIFKEQ